MSDLKLGWITPSLRTKQQNELHAQSLATMAPRFTLDGKPNQLAPGEKILLTDAWKNPTVVAEVGMVFPRFHQLTGSCVGAGGGQALFTLIAIQRLLAVNPTKAFIPFWPYSYGRCRANEGDRGQGEGAMGSSFAATVVKEGVISASEPGLPQFQNNDGLVLTSSLEYQWSDGNSSLVTKWIPTGKQHPMGSAAPCNGIEDILTAISNGYPCTFACDRYIGSASIRGSGSDAAVVGKWDRSGGHQQSVHGVWYNRTLGPLYWAQNNWPGNTYPADPGGGPICGNWVTEADVTAAFRYNAEVYAFSHLAWFPAQPDVQRVLSWEM